MGCSEGRPSACWPPSPSLLSHTHLAQLVAERGPGSGWGCAVSQHAAAHRAARLSPLRVRMQVEAVQQDPSLKQRALWLELDAAWRAGRPVLGRVLNQCPG